MQKLNNSYKRFWFEFELEQNISYPWWVVANYGVTAIDYDDAISILKKKIFNTIDMPRIKKCIENVDIRELDQDHVVVNMNPPVYRGIWYPMGYDH
jgi:hypothetical protein